MSKRKTKIFLATVLLEQNRWTAPRLPSFRVSEWIPKIQAAGFDGIELWANHALLCSEEERCALTASPLPIAVYSSYISFGDDGADAREQASALIARLRATGVKFNFGNEAALIQTYVRNLQQWRQTLPGNCRLLCECHRGTVLETPDRAKDILAPLGDSVGIIVHAFANDVPSWRAHFGSRICHVHVQCGANRVYQRLRAQANIARERLKILRDGGFRGSFSIEFTEGVAQPPEDMDALFRHAVEDMEFIREEMES